MKTTTNRTSVEKKRRFRLKEFKLDYNCDVCGVEMVNRGDSANANYLVIECPACGTAFLLSKKLLRSKVDWERLFSATP